MSSAAIQGAVSGPVRFYQANVGKKAVMAVTGCFLFLFVVGHMIGNLQIYLGPEKLNNYAKFLHGLGGTLWLIRGVLLAILATHITAAVQLWLQNRRARPNAYVKTGRVQMTYAARTMIFSGPILAAFIVYHLLHFTVGSAHPDFNHELDVYRNVVTGFQQIPASLFYIAAMGLLGLHLLHGVWSMFQSVGVSHPRYTPLLKSLAMLGTLVVVVGNISIPVAVMAGLISIR